MQHVHAARARALPMRGLSPQIAMQESAEMLRRDSRVKRRKTVCASTAIHFPACRARYSTCCKFSAMRTPFTSTAL